MSSLFRVMRKLGLYRKKNKNPKYVPTTYEKATFPGQKVQIDVKVVPKSCRQSKKNSNKNFISTRRFTKAKEADKTLFAT